MGLPGKLAETQPLTKGPLLGSTQPLPQASCTAKVTRPEPAVMLGMVRFRLVLGRKKAPLASVSSLQGCSGRGGTKVAVHRLPRGAN